MSQQQNPWQVIESIPGLVAVEAEWKNRFNKNFNLFQSLLRPNGEQALSFPCLRSNGCGCYHTIVKHSSTDIVAICHCGSGCDEFQLKSSDIAIYELNRCAFDATIANLFELHNINSCETGIAFTTQIGIYSPYAGFRFPVFLTIQMKPVDFENVVDSLIARTDSAFILFAPTRDLCSPVILKRLAERNSCFLPLSEVFTDNDQQGLQLDRPLDEILTPFRTDNTPSKIGSNAFEFFPTPTDASWSDISIRFIDCHTISIKVKLVEGIFNYTQMGMVDRRNSNPTKQWDLLRLFAKEKGTLDWNSSGADYRNQKRREKLSRNLRDFFRIEEDPIRLLERGNGWQILFHFADDS